MFDPFNPFHWVMLPLGAAMSIGQSVVMGNPPERTLETLGKGGRHYTEPDALPDNAPPYDPINDIEQGIAPDWKRYEREQG